MIQLCGTSRGHHGGSRRTALGLYKCPYRDHTHQQNVHANPTDLADHTALLPSCSLALSRVCASGKTKRAMRTPLGLKIPTRRSSKRRCCNFLPRTRSGARLDSTARIRSGQNVHRQWQPIQGAPPAPSGWRLRRPDKHTHMADKNNTASNGTSLQANVCAQAADTIPLLSKHPQPRPYTWQSTTGSIPCSTQKHRHSRAHVHHHMGLHTRLGARM